MTSDEKLFDRANPDQNYNAFLRDLVQRANKPSVFNSEDSPKFLEHDWMQLPDGYKGYLSARADGYEGYECYLPARPHGDRINRTPDYIMDTKISSAGQADLFFGRAAEKRGDDLLIFEANIAASV